MLVAWFISWAYSVEHCFMDDAAVGGPRQCLEVVHVTSNCVSVSKGIFLTCFIIFMYVGVLPTYVSVCVQSTKVRRECRIL